MPASSGTSSQPTPRYGGIDTGEAKTALQAGHTESVLFQHYRKMVRREDAEKFWEFYPQRG